MTFEIRKLGPRDAPALAAFLERHAASSMFLRANARAAGLVDEGRPLQGTLVASFEAGAITAVAAHYWSGIVVVQGGDAPERLDALAPAVVARSGRARVVGLSGPLAHVRRAQRALAVGRAVRLDSEEGLYALDLAELRVPPAIASGAIAYRRSRDDDVELLTAWRVDYGAELFRSARGAALEAEMRAEVVRLHAEGSFFLVEEEGAPVACSTFNARLPDCVQVGGVWTPPLLRGRGHARAVVAGSLLDARAEGVSRAILFTGDDNRAAIAAYLAIGFTRVGDYAIVLFADG